MAALSSEMAAWLCCRVSHMAEHHGGENEQQPAAQDSQLGGVAPHTVFAGNKKLAEWAQLTDGTMVDIHVYTAAIAYLHTGLLHAEKTPAMTSARVTTL